MIIKRSSTVGKEGIMRDQRSTATHRLAGRLLRWVLVVTVGEAIGFLVPAVVGLR